MFLVLPHSLVKIKLNTFDLSLVSPIWDTKAPKILKSRLFKQKSPILAQAVSVPAVGWQ